MEIKVNKNILSINNKDIKFSHDIRNYLTIDDKVIVLLSIPFNDETLDNIYCYNKYGIIQWQVQPIKEAFPDLKTALCFEFISIVDNELGATDFYGRRFIINPENGKLIRKEIVR